MMLRQSQRSKAKRSRIVRIMSHEPGSTVNVYFDNAYKDYNAGWYTCEVVEDGSAASVPFTIVRWQGDDASNPEEYSITEGWRIATIVPPAPAPAPSVHDFLEDPQAAAFFWVTLAHCLCAEVVGESIELYECKIVVHCDRPFSRRNTNLMQRTYTSELHPFWLVNSSFDAALKGVTVVFPLPKPLILLEENKFGPVTNPEGEHLRENTSFNICGLSLWDWLMLWHLHLYQVEVLAAAWPAAAYASDYQGGGLDSPAIEHTKRALEQITSVAACAMNITRGLGLPDMSLVRKHLLEGMTQGEPTDSIQLHEWVIKVGGATPLPGALAGCIMKLPPTLMLAMNRCAKNDVLGCIFFKDMSGEGVICIEDDDDTRL